MIIRKQVFSTNVSSPPWWASLTMTSTSHYVRVHNAEATWSYNMSHVLCWNDFRYYAKIKWSFSEIRNMSRNDAIERTKLTGKNIQIEDFLPVSNTSALFPLRTPSPSDIPPPLPTPYPNLIQSDPLHFRHLQHFCSAKRVEMKFRVFIAENRRNLRQNCRPFSPCFVLRGIWKP